MAADSAPGAALEGDVPPEFEEYAEESVPAAAVGSPGKDGRLELAFGTDAEGATVLQRDFARVPFHVSGTLDHVPPADATAVFVQSPTGGVAQGDRHAVSIHAGPGTTALVSTQSATKVQSMTSNYARANVDLSVGRGATLEYVPEATILYPDARFAQSLSIDLDPQATAIVGDVLVPGRLARGEAFDFDRYTGTVSADGPDGALFADRVTLAPDDGDVAGPHAPGVLGDDAVLGTLFVVTTTDADSDALADRMGERVADGEASGGVSTLPNDAGAWVRATGRHCETVTETIEAAWGGARKCLLDVSRPDLRKY